MLTLNSGLLAFPIIIYLTYSPFLLFYKLLWSHTIHTWEYLSFFLHIIIIIIIITIIIIIIIYTTILCCSHPSHVRSCQCDMLNI